VLLSIGLNLFIISLFVDSLPTLSISVYSWSLFALTLFNFWCLFLQHLRLQQLFNGSFFIFNKKLDYGGRFHDWFKDTFAIDRRGDLRVDACCVLHGISMCKPFSTHVFFSFSPSVCIHLLNSFPQDLVFFFLQFKCLFSGIHQDRLSFLVIIQALVCFSFW
jgi:hypothetical protein